MIKIPKKQSSKQKFFLSVVEQALSYKTIASLTCALLLYAIIPAYAAVHLGRGLWKALLVFYPASALIVFYCLRRNSNRTYRLELENEVLDERLNILSDENLKEIKTKTALQEKIRRYHSLKEIIENINRDLSADSVANNLASIAFTLIANQKGVCILYLADPETQRLSLFKTRKEDKKLVIKAKEGDIFDLWVLRHASALLIEDARRDFRFDLARFSTPESRPVASLISSPLLSDHKFLGILRLDSPVSGFYSQDDLRLLVTICDLGAVALENGELFRKTQDLAIHDGLTSLYTKGYFLERIREECKRSFRQKATFSLLMLDIDHFKQYNDTFGHTAGDLVLKELAAVIVSALKGCGAVVSRFGGEEFCVILPHVEKKKACDLAEGLRLKVAQKKILLRGQETSITVSIGVTAFPEDAAEEKDMISKADMAMYQAKEKGRNKVICA